MVSVRSHLRRLKSGKTVWVRSHVRRGPAATSSVRSSRETDPVGALWILLAAVIVIGLVSGGMAAVGKSKPVASETSRTPPATATSIKLPSGPQGRLATLLRGARANIGLSQKEVSARTGIAQSTINDFERALAVPSAESLKTLSRAYQVSLDEWSLMEITRVEIR